MSPPVHDEQDPQPAAPHEEASRTPPAPEGEGLVELNALLGRGTSYVGKLYFEGRVRIEGEFRGEIRGQDILVIGEGAEVEGDIRVDVCIVVGGTVHGNIQARSAIELHVPAVVKGDLHAPAVFIERGVQFEGSCTMAPLDETPAPDGRVALPAPSPPPVRRPGAAPQAKPAPTVPGTPAPPADRLAASPPPTDASGESDGDRHTPVGGWDAPLMPPGGTEDHDDERRGGS
jgi:cytoskeletal protein CcmA (bactofilin family)